MLFPLQQIYLLMVTVLLLFLNRGIWDLFLIIHFHGLTMSRRYANQCLIYLLNKQRLVFKSDLLKLLIESLVLSCLIDCLPVWGPPLTVSDINRLKSLQHRAIRLYLGLQKYDHISQHYCALQWLPLGSEIQYRSLCAMHHQYFQPHLYRHVIIS